MNSDKIILDLCAGSGAWSEPYVKAGYDVRRVTLPHFDVRTYRPPSSVHGVLAAPPCDHFSVSGAQYWKAKDADGRTAEAVTIAKACLDIIWLCHPVWWAVENPVGRFKRLLQMSEPRLIFDPCDYGDPYTKKTLLWGNFTIPVKHRVEPQRVCSQGSWVQKLGGKSDKTKYLRSITPPGFAQAFFEANP